LKVLFTYNVKLELDLHINIQKNQMKKITTFLLLFVITFSQAQLFNSVRTNGGGDNHIASRTVTDWLHYDNGTNANAFGAQSGSATLGVYIKLSPTLLAGHINRQIEEVKFFLGADAANMTSNLTIEIYTDPAAAPVYTEDFPSSSLTPGNWNTVTLSNPFVITGAELYVGYKLTSAGYVIGVDDGSNYVTGVNFYTFNGGAMSSWDNIASYNFNLQVGVGGAITSNDAGVSNINLPAILPQPGNTNIEATITNYGANTLNSIDFNYQVDGGTVQTDQLTGLNIPTGQSTTVTHSVPWNATVGSHNVDVFVSNFNGNGPDDITANDHMIKTFSVASNFTQKKPLYEEFTSSTCPPCANLNSNYFNNSFLSTNTGKYNLIKYQMNWPSPGDPYYTSEGGDRRAYYGVNSVPTLFLDGFDGTHFNTIALQQDLDAAYAEPAFFAMTSSYSIDPNTKDINVTVNVNPYLSGDYTLHCAVVEKTTTGNVGNNGETEFYNVMMKMVPDANGTAAAVVADVPESFNITANLNGTNIEEYSDLEVIVFLQDTGSKKVMQSVKSVDSSGAVEDVVFSSLKIYPNPTTGSLFINNAEDMSIEIYNISGNLLFKEKDLSNQTNISLDNLTNGVYFVKFIKDDKIDLRKIVVNK